MNTIILTSIRPRWKFLSYASLLLLIGCQAVDLPVLQNGTQSGMSYRAAGQYYKVLPSAAGYRARGIASWYGTKFHKRRTSSGESYNMHAMTAAHKTLPLYSYVRVKNLDNGRETVVRVNDRGPFRHDRIIDLSYAAAAKLGILARGTASVELQALSTGKSLTPPSRRVPTYASKRPLRQPLRPVSKYYLQVGSFSSSARAVTLRRALQPFIKNPIRIESHRPYYVVKIGPFPDKTAVNRAKISLARHGVRRFLTTAG
jgi:rare lipoprotein A